MPIAIVIKDTESKLLLMNKTCELQWGLSFKDLYGTDASLFFPPEQMKQFLTMDQEVLLNASQIDFEEIIWNSILRHKQPVFDNVLIRQFSVSQPNQVYAYDITYIWTHLAKIATIWLDCAHGSGFAIFKRCLPTTARNHSFIDSISRKRGVMVSLSNSI